jgi:hypothetical protein
MYSRPSPRGTAIHGRTSNLYKVGTCHCDPHTATPYEGPGSKMKLKTLLTDGFST